MSQLLNKIKLVTLVPMRHHSQRVPKEGTLWKK